jgi:RNA polymerase sigma-70 factor, ECF subfamily
MPTTQYGMVRPVVTPLTQWPGLKLPEAEFEAWALARDAPSLSPARQAELHLAFGCVQGNADALRLFDQVVLRQVELTVARFGNEAFVADVCQLVRHRLLVAEDGGPRLGEFRGRGELTQFVRGVAVRTALNLREHEGRHTRALSDDALVDTPAPTDDPELVAIKMRYREEFKQAFSAAMASLEQAQRTVLRLYYLDGLGLAALAKLNGWSVPTASRRLAAARNDLLDSTRRTLVERLQLSPLELDSLLRLIRSRLTVDAFPEPAVSGG